MNIKEIIIEYLKKNKYDGLYDPDDWCACALDDLLFCSSEFIQRCEPGIRKPCNCVDPEDLAPGENPPHDFHIVERKEEHKHQTSALTWEQENLPSRQEPPKYVMPKGG